MANNQLYTTAAVYLNDELLFEAMKVSVKVNGNHVPIKTLAKGFAGVSKGATIIEITVSSAVPQVGFEAEVSPYIINVEEVKLTLFMASSTMTIKGFIMSTDIDKAIDSEATQGFVFDGGEAIFE